MVLRQIRAGELPRLAMNKRHVLIPRKALLKLEKDAALPVPSHPRTPIHFCLGAGHRLSVRCLDEKIFENLEQESARLEVVGGMGPNGLRQTLS